MSRVRKGWLVAGFFMAAALAWRRHRGKQDRALEPTRGLRLAYVAQSVHRSAGPPGYVAELVERFAPDHQVTVISSEIEERLRPQVRHYRVPLLARSWLFNYISFTIANSLLLGWRRLLGDSFDIIHSNGLDSPLLGDVFTCHFCEGAGLELEERGLGRLPATTWKQRLRSWDYHWYRHVVARVERLVARRLKSRRLIAVSTRTRDDLVAHCGADAAKLTVISNGVDLVRFHPQNRGRFCPEVRQELGLADGEMMLLFVGYDWERKGLPQLLAALALLASEKARLVVVGRGEVAHYASLAQALGVAAQVDFVGPSVQVERYYAAADIFVFPTLYEPFGLVIVEAMASGLPVLTSRRAGAADCIADGESGLLLDDPTDPGEIATKLAQLIEDPELRQRLGQAARKAVSNLSWDEVARRTLGVYRQVREEKRAAGKRQSRPEPVGRVLNKGVA